MNNNLRPYIGAEQLFVDIQHLTNPTEPRSMKLEDGPMHYATMHANRWTEHNMKRCVQYSIANNVETSYTYISYT